MSLRVAFPGRIWLYIAALALLVISWNAFAQEAPPPKVDIFAGYSWINPGNLGSLRLKSITPGWGVSPTYNFNRFLGLSFDGDAHYGDNFNVSTITIGPRLKLRAEHFEPFIQALVGLHRLSIAGLGTDNNLGAVLGGGIDLPLTTHFGWRVIEGDYVYGRHSFSALASGTNSMNGARLRSGILLMLGGGAPRPPLAASCSINPSSVMAGEPVTMTTTTSNVIKGHSVTYNFSSTGGKTTPKDNVVTVDTTGLEPGQYRVSATATDPKAKKMAPATCSSSFTVQAPPKHPPTVACSANPTTVQAGTPATITATGQSPDNRPLTYNFTATGGRLTPNGAQATLDTAGASAGPINVTCTATDGDGGSSAAATHGQQAERDPIQEQAPAGPRGQ